MSRRVEGPYIAVLAGRNQLGRSAPDNRFAQPDRPRAWKHGQRDLLGNRVRRIIWHRSLFLIGAVVVQRIDHYPTLDREPYFCQQRSELRRNGKSGIVRQQHVPAMPQIVPEDLDFGGCVGASGPEIGDDRAILGDGGEHCRPDWAITVANGLDRQLEPVEPVRWRFQYIRAPRRLATHRLHMTEMHVARRVTLAMPGNKANRLDPALQDPLDGIGYLTQIHCVLDLRATAF